MNEIENKYENLHGPFIRKANMMKAVIWKGPNI